MADLPPDVQQADALKDEAVDWLVDDDFSYDEHVRRVELALINRALARTGGNKRQAAELLSLKRTTLIEKLKRLQRD